MFAQPFVPDAAALSQSALQQQQLAPPGLQPQAQSSAQFATQSIGVGGQPVPPPSGVLSADTIAAMAAALHAAGYGVHRVHASAGAPPSLAPTVPAPQQQMPSVVAEEEKGEAVNAAYRQHVAQQRQQFEIEQAAQRLAYLQALQAAQIAAQANQPSPLSSFATPVHSAGVGAPLFSGDASSAPPAALPPPPPSTSVPAPAPAPHGNAALYGLLGMSATMRKHALKAGEPARTLTNQTRAPKLESLSAESWEQVKKQIMSAFDTTGVTALVTEGLSTWPNLPTSNSARGANRDASIADAPLVSSPLPTASPDEVYQEVTAAKWAAGFIANALSKDACLPLRLHVADVPFGNVRELLRQLDDYFLPRTTVQLSHLIMQAQNVAQKEDESIDDYYVRHEQAQALVPKSFQVQGPAALLSARTNFIAHFRREDTRAFLSMHAINAVTIKEVVDQAKSFEATVVSTKAQSALNRSLASQQQSSPSSSSRGAQALATTPRPKQASSRGRPRTRTRAGPVCFNCDKEGHVLRNCPELSSEQKESSAAEKCSYCGRTGHTEAKCRTRQRDSRKAKIEAAKQKRSGARANVANGDSGSDSEQAFGPSPEPQVEQEEDSEDSQGWDEPRTATALITNGNCARADNPQEEIEHNRAS